MQKLILAGVAAVALLTGCAGGLPGIPGLSAGGGGTTAAPDLKALYVAGRKWEYNVTTGSLPTDTMSIEVTEVSGTKATIKTTIKGTSTTSTVDTADKDAFSKMSGAQTAVQAGAQTTVGQSITESVTVPAGTYSCVKTTSTSTYSQGGVSSTSTSETWINSGVGLVKAVTNVKTSLPAGMPAVPGMGADVKNTMELKSFK